MIAIALTLVLLAAQPAPAPAAPAAAPAPAVVPAPAPAAAPAAEESPSPRLDAALAALKGKPKTSLTAKLGPADTVRQAIDGQALFWTIRLEGETVCGANASGALVCGRQGDGQCIVVAAFDQADAMTVWRIVGLPTACEKAADMLLAPPVAAPKYKSGR
ncbi:MAG: hypothetical protein EON95_02315 [Caulobacteraceae bacterium]|nr:MAG: hypothetical protein EON95_02315 [Caulobacteraceae bacterium]